MLLFLLFSILAVFALYQFITAKEKHNPLWLMLAAWAVGLGVPQLNLSEIEVPWPTEFWILILASLASFALGVWFFSFVWKKYPIWKKFNWLKKESFSVYRGRVVVYGLFAFSLLGLFLFYLKAGNFPLLAEDPDVFRFAADEEVPGLINYTAQLARIYIPLSFFIIFFEKFNFKKHWDLVLLCVFGALALILFASRTQIFFIDLWVMALYLFMRKPNLRQAAKFYPVFLLISVIVLAAVPLIRQYHSYGESYLSDISVIKAESLAVPGVKYILPIYVGISFNMQALLHATEYYSHNPIQWGRVTLDPFTNILGLHQYSSEFDLGEIFFDWWNTGTYLFPFVQDFGQAAYFFIPFLIAGIITLIWLYFRQRPNFLSLNLYAYACFFIVMTIYLSFTVRAEMYLDLFIIFLSFLFVSHTLIKRPLIKSAKN